MIDKPGQISEGSGQGGALRPNPSKSRPAEPEPNRLCRRCDLPFQQYVHHRTGNNTCRLCKNALQRAYKKAKRNQPDRPPPERAQPSMPVLRWLADQKVTP